MNGGKERYRSVSPSGFPRISWGNCARISPGAFSGGTATCLFSSLLFFCRELILGMHTTSMGPVSIRRRPKCPGSHGRYSSLAAVRSRKKNNFCRDGGEQKGTLCICRWRAVGVRWRKLERGGGWGGTCSQARASTRHMARPPPRLICKRAFGADRVASTYYDISQTSDDNSANSRNPRRTRAYV